MVIIGALPSEALGPQKHGHEIEEKAESRETGEPEVEGHKISPSRIAAQPDISERHRCQPQHQCDPDQVLHHVLGSNVEDGLLGACAVGMRDERRRAFICFA
jgi:hypothetical protein